MEIRNEQLSFIDEHEETFLAACIKHDLKENSMNSSEKEKAESEWAGINEMPLIDVSNKQHIPHLPIAKELNCLRCVTLEETIKYFKKLPIQDQLERIQPCIQRKGLLKFCPNLFGVKTVSLKQSLTDERNRIFAIALHAFDNQDEWQLRFLSTLYQKLTGEVLLEWTRYGNHWETLGFQGMDPATDFRGVGLLGLFQMLQFILTPKTNSLAKRIYRLSLDEQQHFPFAVMSTNITQITLQCLREGLLNKQCNKTSSVFETVNDFYCGTFLQLYMKWSEENKTIKDSGYVLQEIRQIVRKNTKNVLKDLNAFVETCLSLDTSKQNEVQFSNIGQIELS